MRVVCPRKIIEHNRCLPEWDVGRETGQDREVAKDLIMGHCII